MLLIASIKIFICIQDIKNFILHVFPLVSLLAHFGMDTDRDSHGRSL